MLIGSLSGCAAVNHPSNVSVLNEEIAKQNHSVVENKTKQNDVTVILAFSGGGTRAAAFSYGVLKELKKTEIQVNGESRSLLSEVDVVSSVSGGSFTAAYYGLYQDKIFVDYEEEFLKRDVKDDLIGTFLSPSRWFTRLSRTDSANNYYQDQLFGDATFGDIDPSKSPHIIINASDITTGTRFSFIQEYFNFLCSDVSEFPISKAVAASAAVPILFEPVALENYEGCEQTNRKMIADASINELSYRSMKAVEDVREYDDKEKNQYIHLVDGGITDNLGLMAIYDLLEVGRFHTSIDYSGATQHHIVVISVDASTDPELGIGQSVDYPSISQTLNSITDIQLHRYNDATKALFIESMSKWAKESSSESIKVVPHFIELGFKYTQDEDKRYLLNQVPTDLTLKEELVDTIIGEGEVQLRQNDEYKKVLLNF
jgi:NTE family protein